ncbi:MAG TPA: GNAT family N-acetyltransferase, partial [Nitriliruptorales bacterium]
MDNARSDDHDDYVVRHTEPGDYEAVSRIFSGPKAVYGTMQLPFPSAERWRKRLADPQDGVYGLVACLHDEVVANLGLTTFPLHARRRHVGRIGMAVRDDHQGRGAGTLLLR